MVPLLDTDRLILRSPELKDFDASAALWADPVVTRHIGGVPSTRQQSWARFMSYLGHWQLMGFGYWAVIERSSDRYVGELGFADFKREMEPPVAGFPELGWALCPEFHGRGYATEALRAAIAWAETCFRGRFSRAVCIIDPANAPSLNVARKLGFGQLQQALYKGGPVLLFERRFAS